MKKKIFLIIFILVVLGVGTAIIHSFTRADKEGENKPKLEEVNNTENITSSTPLPTNTQIVVPTTVVTAPAVIIPEITTVTGIDPDAILDITYSPAPSLTPVITPEKNNLPPAEDQFIEETERTYLADQYTQEEADNIMDELESLSKQFWAQTFYLDDNRDVYINTNKSYTVDKASYQYSSVEDFGAAFYDAVQERNIKANITNYIFYMEKLRYDSVEDVLLFQVYGCIETHMSSNTLPESEYSHPFFLGFLYKPEIDKWLIYDIKLSYICEGKVRAFHPEGLEFGVRGEYRESWNLGFD